MLYKDRAGHCCPAFGQQASEALSDKDFLEKTRAAVQKQTGLIHGSMVDDSGEQVCALGALAMEGDVVVPSKLANELQEFNDSMPEAPAQTRRDRVVAWLNEKLGVAA